MLFLHLQVVLVALISLATASDRWVWSGQRNSRQLVKVFSPFFPPPFLRPLGGLPLASATSSSRQTRRPKVSDEPPAVADQVVPDPSRPAPRGVLQKSLVVQPLPLDISKLPLENSPAEGFQDVFAPHPPDSLLSSDQDLVLTLPEQDHIATIQQDPPTPSLQTKTGHVEALVATPDISQLPLQSSSSLPFSPSSSSDVSPAAVEDETPLPASDAVVFPLRTTEVTSSSRTAPPPSSTPVPTRIFLRGFNVLDDSPFLRGDDLQEKRILKTLEALQKESLAVQNSRDIKLAFQNLQRLAEGHNSVQALDEDRVIFPKLLDSVSSASRNGALRVVEPPRFGDDGKTSEPPIVFSLPVLQPHTSSSSLQADPLRPEGPPMTTDEGNTLTMIFKEPKAVRQSRRVPHYAWLWPGETPDLAGPKAFHQPASHAL